MLLGDSLQMMLAKCEYIVLYIQCNYIVYICKGIVHVLMAFPMIVLSPPLLHLFGRWLGHGREACRCISQL